MLLKTSITGFRSLLYRNGWFYNIITRRLYDQDVNFLSRVNLIEKGPKRDFYKRMGFNNTYKILDEYITVGESQDIKEVFI